MEEEDSEVPAGDDLPCPVPSLYLPSFYFIEDDDFDDYYGDLVEKLDAGGRIH